MAVLAALAGVGSVRGHHSGYMYQSTPIWIEGTVVSFERRKLTALVAEVDRALENPCGQ